MAERQVAPMHPEFPRWYSMVSFGEDRERLQRRWEGVAALVDSASRADVETMVRVVFRARQAPRPDAVARVRRAFRDADDRFEAQGNDRELEILCGVALASLLQSRGKIAAAAALAVTTAWLDGARALDLPMDLVSQAERALIEIAEADRTRPALKQDASVPQLSFETAAAKIREQANFEGVIAAFLAAAESTRVALTEVVRKSTTSMSTANHFIAVQGEELQMLWWLVGDRSWDFDLSFGAIPADARPLVLGKELADLSGSLPGPASTKALLYRAGLKERKKLTIPDAVNACDISWLGRLVDNSDPSSVLQPIHFAIRRKLETGDNASWVAGWAAATGVDATHGIRARELGNLFYRERLLVRFPGD